MKVELEPREIELIVYELESEIAELRGLIASGMRKDLRDDVKKDKFTLVEIVDKLRAAVKAGEIRTKVERAA